MKTTSLEVQLSKAYDALEAFQSKATPWWEMSKEDEEVYASELLKLQEAIYSLQERIQRTILVREEAKRINLKGEY